VVDYQSLYRRYRPQRFAEVRGQDHVVNALRHAARDNRIAHAYLFSGPRGTGKTSTARILAKALNCSNPVEGEPCGTCDSCTDIARGASFDVHELDAASNNGVDAMRDLVARASLATPGRWKVYIVDEVHMLSPAASNALLKTLEEPPDHVVFVLATTDPQKVLPTIRSRTQHYEFHLLDAEVLALLLAEIASDAQLELPETAVEAAVRRGRGSARDALSALDQVVASGVVEDDSPFLYELLVSLVERDTRRALQAVESAHVAGRDAPRIATELLDELRGQFLGAVAPGLAREGEASAPSVTGPASPQGGLVLLIGPARTVRAMEVLGTAMVAMRDALDARITLEVALVRLTHPEADDDPAALLERIERLERRVQDLTQGAVTAAPGAPPAVIPPPHLASTPPVPSPPRAGARPPTDAPPQGDQQDSSPAERDVGSQPALGAFRSSAAERAQTPSQAPEPLVRSEAPAKAETAMAAPPESDVPPPTRDEFVAAWGDHVLSQLRPRVRAVFAVGRFVATDRATAILALPNSAHVERAKAQSDEVAEALGRYFGRPIGLRLVAESDVGGASFSGRSDSHATEPVANGQRRSAATPLVASGAQGDAPVLERTARVVEPEPRPVPEDPAEEMLDPNDLDPHGEHVAGDALSWAQDRLMEAFPGAEEV
jgi:DNA polymerase III subunit gamma/tau